jgi:imidazolonepropionase
MKAIKNISNLVQITDSNLQYKTNQAMNNVCELEDVAMIFDEKIVWIGKNSELEEYYKNFSNEPIEFIDAKGKAVIPGFVDSHTHIVFGGNRAYEFARRMQGATYLEIAEEGGGIQSTVRATRAATLEELVASGSKLINNAIIHGTVALEIKSGYGLDTETEIKMLEAIKILRSKFPIEIKTTFLGAHDFPIEYKGKRDEYVDLICNEMLPKVAENNLADYCDAFVDKGYYTIEQGRKIFNRSKELGLQIRMHADELAWVGAAELAAEVGAKSADHLLFVSDQGIEQMRNANVVATLLPGTSFFIRLPYANARKIIDNGAITALATDCNPGSSYNENMLMVLWLATLNLRMTAEEALTAATLNAAYSMDLSDKLGSLEIGKEASFLILDTDSYKDMFYHYGYNHIAKTFVKGKEFSGIDE